MTGKNDCSAWHPHDFKESLCSLHPWKGCSTDMISKHTTAKYIQKVTKV